MRTALPLVLLFGLPASVAAAAERAPEPAPLPWVVQVGVSLPGLDLTLRDDRRNLEVAYNANIAQVVSVGLSYEGLGASVGLAVGDPADDPEKFGRTRAMDYQLHYYRGGLGLDAYYQDMQGYALEKLPDGCLRGEACSREPKLRLRHLGLTGLYAFNPRYSLKAAFEASERQRRDAGTWLLLAGVDRLALDNPTPLKVGADGPEVRAVSGVMGAVGGGYGHLWIWDAWYLAPVITVAVGVAQSDFSPGAEGDVGLAFKGGVRLGGGYNADTWFTGIAAVLDAPTLEQDVTAEFLAGEVRLFGGLRF